METGTKVKKPTGDTESAGKARPAFEIDAQTEDALYLRLDKLLALCAIQSAWAAGDDQPSSATRHHYALIMEEQALELRKLIDCLFP